MDMGGQPRVQRTACRRCHARKVRCDAAPGRPCSGCRFAGTPCLAHEKRRRNRGPPKATTLATLLPTPAPQPARDVPVPAEDRDSEVDQVAATLSSLQDAAWSEEVQLDSAPPGSTPADAPGSPDSDDTSAAPPDVKRHLVEMLSQEDIAARVMQRGVRIVYVGQEYSNIHYLIRQRVRHAPPSVHHFASNPLSRRVTAHQLDRIPRAAFALPPAAVVDELLAAYFRHVHPGFPVLDEAVFMAQYRRRDPLNPPSLLVLQAVLMVGAHVCAHRPDRAALKTAFFRRAKMLFDARFEWNRDVVVQAALLLTWHAEGVDDIGANAYYWVGIAARTALGLGMHRDAAASTLIAQDQRLWRRIWWILVQFDVLVSLSYGRPQALRLDESDVPELRPEDVEAGPGDGSHALSPIDADFMVHQTRLCCIIAHTLRERFGLHVAPDRRRAALADADRRLARWMAALPSSLRPSARGPSAAAMPPWVAMLHMTYNNFLILLHRPPPPQPQPQPQSQLSLVGVGVTGADDMGICASAAASMVQLLEEVAARDELRLLNVFAVDALFTVLIQLSAEIRVANPVLAAHAMRRFDGAMDILRRLATDWLNAEIILRLFEDSSERLRTQLSIGKNSVSAGSADSAGSVDSADSADGISPAARDTTTSAAMAQLELPGIPPPVDVMQALMMSPATTLQQHLASLNEQLDWTNLYWENSGFTSLSPFAEMRMYPA